jgi:hypothetical protein
MHDSFLVADVISIRLTFSHEYVMNQNKYKQNC